MAPKKPIAIPVSIWAAAIAGAGTRRASRTTAGMERKTSRQQASIGRWGFQRRARTPPISAPTPKAAAIIPHGAPTANIHVVAQTMIAHSHVRETSSCHPPASSAAKLSCFFLRGARLGRSRARHSTLTTKVPASTAKTTPGFQTATTTPATAGPRTNAPLRERPRIAFACWRRGGLTVAGTSPVAAVEERFRDPVDGDQDDQVPELGGAAQQKDGGRQLDGASDDVGAEHDQLPRQPVGPDAADEDEGDERERMSGEDDAERGGGAVKGLDDRERERDRHEPVPECRGRLPEPEQAKLPLPQRPERVDPGHAWTLRQGVLGPCSTFGRGQPAALRGDRTALHAVRRRDLDASVARLVDLGGAHSLPQHAQLLRDLRLHAEVIGRVVARPVAGEVDARELVEGELPVGRGVALRPVGADDGLVGVALGGGVAGWKGATARGHRPRHHPAQEEASPERLPHVPHLLEVAPDEAPLHGLVVGGERSRRPGRAAGPE